MSPSAKSQTALPASDRHPVGGSGERIPQSDAPPRLHLLTAVDRAAIGIVVIHLLPVAWLITGGGLYLDDLRAQAYARNQPFWSFIVSSNRTHLAPGPRTIDWLQAHHAPLEHWPAVVVTLLVHLLLGVVAWLLLRALVGPRPAALLPLAVLLLTPSLVSATAWYRQTLTTLVPLALVLAAAYCTLRFVRRGSWWWAGGTVALVCTGLLFSERVIAGCALVVALSVVVALADGARSPRRLRRMARPAALATALGLVATAYIAVYRSGPFDQGTTNGLNLGDGLTLLTRSLGLGVVPSLFGGPWHWRPSGPSLSVADAPAAAALACCVVLGLALVFVAWRRRAHRRVLGAIVVAAAYIVPIEIFVFLGRYAAFGEDVARDLRLFADCAVVLVIALAVAFLGLVPRTQEAGRQHPGTQPRHSLFAGLLIAVVFITGASVSWASFGATWHGNATSAYLATLRDDLAQAQKAGTGTSLSVLPGSIPDDVIPGWMQKEISSLDLVALLSPATELALSAPDKRIVSEAGELVPGGLMTVQEFDPGADNFCRHRVEAGADQPLTIGAPTTVDYKRDELVELGLLVDDESRIDVDVVADDGSITPLAWPRPTTLPRGPYVVRLRVPHGVQVDAVRVHPTPVGMCVVSVKVVVPVVAR